MIKASFTDIALLLPMLACICLYQFMGHLPNAGKETERAHLQDNTPPKITILAPKAGDTYLLESRVPYKIAISDKEDGESKYDEITSGEVLLAVQFIANPGNSEAMPKTAPDPGLLDIAASNCLYCHAFRGNLIGPSFYEIGVKYQNTNPDKGEIAKRILNGSTGVWGDKVMPSHPELTPETVMEMLQWIGKFASSEEVRYYNGLEGTIDLQHNTPKSVAGEFVVTSYYRDHGIGGSSRKTGTAQVVLSVNK